MNEFRPNRWNDIRRFYRWAMPYILEEEQDEWGIDPYAWDEHQIIFMTPIEQWLWSDIRSLGAIFYPQVPVERFFVDFANPKAKVVLECDGAEFHQDTKRDDARDRLLGERGWTVYRFPGWMCRTETDYETGEVGAAYKRLREICRSHKLIRGSLFQRPSRLVAPSEYRDELIAEFARGQWWEAA